MYKAIYDYARAHDLVERKYRCKRQIAAYIVLDSEGNYQYIEGIDKKKHIKTECPDIGSFVYSGSSTAIICEKFCHIFCKTDDEKKFGDPVRHGGWLDVMKEGAENNHIIHTIYSFLQRMEENAVMWGEIFHELQKNGVKEKDFISFRVGGMDAEKDDSWGVWFDDYMDRKNAAKNQIKKVITSNAISSLSGEIITPIKGKEIFPQILTSQTGMTRPYIASFGEDAFQSYGLNDNRNTPMSQEEAGAIKAGIENLFTSEHNHSDEFSLIYWYTGEDVPDVAGRALARNGFKIVLEQRNDNKGKKKKNKERTREMYYQEVLDSVFKGVDIKHLRENGKYHIIHFVIPSKGRIFFTNERIGTYQELYDNLNRWYKESLMNYPSQASHTLCNIYGILQGLIDHKNVKNKLDEAKNEFGEDVNRLLDAIFQGDQIPRRMYHHALNRFTQSVLEGRFTSEGNELDQPTRIPLQIIKTYLIREGKDMDVTLNQNSTNVAYQCGRWLAAMDQLQKRSANGKIGVTLGQKFYRAAKRQPAKILTMVTDYKEIYLGRISNDGLRIYFEKLLGEISEKIGESFPENFSITDQGAFDMGYAQQHQNFFSKGSNVENTDDESEEED